MRFAVLACIAATSLIAGQQPKEGSAGDAQKLVTIRRIIVEGSRLPALSVIRLAQLKVGDQVNFNKLFEALQKVTKSGLILNIDFEYESIPNQENDVILHMQCKDAEATALASISISKVDEAAAWTWLQNVDPLFTREMPPTEAAISFYSHWITKYLEATLDPKFAQGYAVVAEATSSTGNSTTDRLVFKAVKRREVR